MPHTAMKRRVEYAQLCSSRDNIQRICRAMRVQLGRRIALQCTSNDASCRYKESPVMNGACFEAMATRY